MMKKWIAGFVLVLLGLQFSSYATHILGGELTYKYLGSDGPADRPFRYMIHFVGYVDRVGTPGQLSNWGCGNLGNNPTMFIFDAETNQRITKSSTETGWRLPSHGNQVQGACSINPYYGGIRPLVLPIPAGCDVPGASELNIAITDTMFEVNLPLSLTGYKVRYENCCRTENTTNLFFPGGNANPGNTWLASIPSPIFVNSSPQFIGDAVPFFCRGDTTVISNNAFDPDGDRLIYSFATPYSGSIATQPTFSDPGAASFAPGFSAEQPFGPNGFASINPSTGLTKYYCNVNGNYAVAIDIQEYRQLSNGTEILLSTTRREFLVVVKDCEPNPPPTPIISTGGTSTGTTFVRNEGDSVVFSVAAFDQNNITISAQSELFDPNNGSGQVAVCDSVSGTDTVRTTFRWKIDCGITGGIVRNYSVVVKYQDEGCPPKTNNVVYTIIVNPFKAPQIDGRDSLCSTDPGIQSYSVPGGTGRKWKAIGATFIGSDTTSNVTLNIPGDNATLRLVVTSGLGCKDSSSLQIRKFPFVPIIASAPSAFVCQDSSIRLQATGGYTTVRWTPSLGLNSATVRNPLATLSDTTSYIVSSSGSGGCLAKDTVNIKWIPKVAAAGPDSVLCSGLTRVIGTNQITRYKFYSYQWSPAAGLASDTSFQTLATLQNSGQANQAFQFIQTATHRASNCKSSDTVRLFVKPLPVVNAGPDTATICSGASVRLGTVDNSNSLFSWLPVTGLGSPDKDTTSASLNPDVQNVTFQKYILRKTEILVNSPPGEPVCTNTDSITLRVNPLPFFDLASTDSVCSGLSTTIGTSPQNGFSYSWSPSFGLSSSDSSITNVSLQNSGSVDFDTTYTLLVTNSGTGCNREKQIQVRVDPLPVVSAGADASLCSGDTIQIGEANQQGFQYQWNPSLGLNNPQLSDPLFTLINPVIGGSTDTYNFKLTKTNNKTKCRNADSLIVSVKPLPIAIAASDDTVQVCSNQDLQLGSPSLNQHVYAWVPDSSLSSSQVSNPVLNVNNPSQQKQFLNYRVNVENQLTQCKNSDEVVVQVNPLPIVPLAYADTMVCSRDTIFIGGASVPGYSYNWSPATGVISSSSSLSGFSFVHSAAQPLIVNLNLGVTIGETNCQNSALLQVQVNPLPDANAGADKIFCSKDSVQIGVNPVAGFRYQWSPVTGLSNPNISNPVLTLVNNGTTEQNVVYTVTVFDTTLNTRCDSSDAVSITVRPLPEVVAATQDTLAICAGFQLQLGISAGEGLGYSWLPADSLSSSLISNPVFTSTQATDNAGIRYVLTATNLSTGCKKSDSVQVRVNALPQISAGPDRSICSGDSIAIGEIAEAGFSYSWSPAGGLSDSLLAGPTVRLENPNTGGISIFVPFKVTKINNGTSCRNFDSLEVEVKPLPIANAAVGDSLVVCSKSDLGLGEAGLADHVYQWVPDTALNSAAISNPVLNANNPSQQVVFLNYQVNVLNNQTGCRNKDGVVVKVNPLPIVPLAYADTSVCTKDTLVLGGQGTTGISYSWTPRNQLNDSTLSSPEFTAVNNTDAPQTYSYVLLATNNATTCRDSRSLTVAVNPLPDANAGADKIICSRDSVQIGVSPVAGFRYQWSPVTGLSNPNISNPVLTLVNNGTTELNVVYTVTVFDTTLNTRCDSSDAMSITVRPLPEVVAATQDTLAICAGFQLQLGISAGEGLGYSWLPADSLSSSLISNPVFTSTQATDNAGIRYVLTATNLSTGCKKSDSVQVRVNALPQVTAGPDRSICSGDSIAIGENGEAGFSYSWSPAGGLNDPQLAGPTVRLENPATGGSSIFVPFKVTKTNNGTSCRNFDSLLVEVKPLPIANAAVGDSLVVCSKSDLGLGEAGLADHVYQWVPDTALNSAAISNPVLNANNPSQQVVFLSYQLNVLNNQTGCRNKDGVVVKVNPLPIVPLAYADTSVCTKDTLVLGGQGTAGISYSWSPRNQLNDSTLSSPEFTAVNNTDAPQTYAYVLLATNNATTCRDSRSLTVAVNPLPDANAGADKIICSRDSVQIGVSPVAGFRYQWSPVTGLSNPNIANPFVMRENNGSDTISITYTVQVWDSTRSTGCDSSDVMVLKVKPAPPAVAYAQDTLAVCATLSAQLGISGDPALNYSWSPAQFLSSNTVSNPVFSSPSSAISPGLLYVLTVTNPVNSCTKKDSVQIFVNPLPLVVTGTLDSLCSGDTIQIGPGQVPFPADYLWSGPGLFPSPTNPNPLLTLINNSDTVQSQTYKLIVTNPVTGCRDSSSLVVRVNPLPPVFAGADRSICSGANTTIGQAAQTGFSYAWNANAGLSSVSAGDPVFTATTPLGIIRQDTLSLVMINTTTQCRKRDSVVVTTNPLPAPVQFSLFSPTVCPFTQGVAYQVANPETGTSYQWNISGGTQASGGTNPSISVNWGASNPSAEVWVLPTNQFGCVGKADSIAISLNQNLTPVKPIGDSVLCSLSKTGRLYNTAGTTGSTYIWSLQGATISTDTTVNAQISVDWNINNGLGFIWIQEQSSAVDPVTGTPVQCFGQSDTLKVRINPSPDSTLAISGVGGVCANPNGIVEGYRLPGYAGSTYQWQVDPSIAPIIEGQGSDSIRVSWQVNGQYQIRVVETSDKGCVGIPITRNIIVNPLPLPGLSSLSPPLTICPNDLSNRGYIAQSAPGFLNSTFNWTVIGGTPTTATNDRLLAVNWGTSGNYQLILRETTAAGCSKDTILPLQYDPSALRISQVSLLENDESKVEIRFQMENQETNPAGISLYRQEGNSNSWIELQADLPKSTTSYTDEPPVGAIGQVWKYKISGKNICNLAIESDVHNTILLQGTALESDQSANLSWNPYVGWEPGPVYRIQRGTDEFNLSDLETGIPASAQPAKKLLTGGDAFNQWYRVVADGPNGEVSYSNKIRLDFKNQPAFYNLMLRSSLVNNVFMVKNLDLYRDDNELVITNRWGREVFRKKNYRIDDLWKGNDVDDGIYYFNFTAPNFKSSGWVEIRP